MFVCRASRKHYNLACVVCPLNGGPFSALRVRCCCLSRQHVGGKGRKHGVTGKSCVPCGRGGRGGEGGRHGHRKNALTALPGLGGNDSVSACTCAGRCEDSHLYHLYRVVMPIHTREFSAVQTLEHIIQQGRK